MGIKINKSITPGLRDSSVVDYGKLDKETLRKYCLGHWYPSPNDPPKEILTQREQFKPFTRLVELKAGKRYLLPKDLGTLVGRQR